MIRVRKGDAEKDGGCNECHARGQVLCLDIGHDQLRLCERCAAMLLSEVVIATGKRLPPPKAKKTGESKAALDIRCPYCKAAPGKKCVRLPGGLDDVPADGAHYSRKAEARGGQQTFAPTGDRPALRVRDMAPRTQPSKRSKGGSGRPAARTVPKPYKARRN